jgi:hypothetical protein
MNTMRAYVTGLAMAGLTPAVAQAQEAAAQTSGCELRVFPTVNYIGLNTGLLSGFGIVGAVADLEAHKGKVATVKDLMAGYLGPDIQMEELNKIGLVKTLGLPTDTSIIVEQPTPSHDEAKADPAVKAAAKAMNASMKAGKRLTASTATCYSELLIFNVFYHKAMMYGSNLFVGTMFRDFRAAGKPPVVSAGAVKNPLENFPPKTADMVDAAKAELRDAFSKDFVEWSQKKLVKPGAVKTAAK